MIPSPNPTLIAEIERLRVIIHGAVQGVGFRPFVYRLAKQMSLMGWVRNGNNGVEIEVEGTHPLLVEFLTALELEKPPLASIQSLEPSFLSPLYFPDFSVLESNDSGAKTALILPDIATCPDCLADILDPANRRYRYPFTNCTNCGPRYTIIKSLPYDRPNTAMHHFPMCPECLDEYCDPSNRRFHAQPNACPVCGPQVELWDRMRKVLARREEVIPRAAEIIRNGGIVAVKGLGGFQLMADARNERAILELRRRKHRDEKPFAVMYPSLESLADDCIIDAMEERLLRSPQAPIVLLQRKGDSPHPATFSPSSRVVNPSLGAMLPCTPLHHLLMRELGFPIIATSGNLSDEPICTDEHNAAERLKEIADYFLVHNRPILRHADDSVVRVVMERELVLRRARGYAPLPVEVKGETSHTASIIAVGGHLKNTVAATVGRQIFVSQHIGDLGSLRSNECFRDAIEDFKNLYGIKKISIIHDAHPDYSSSHYAQYANENLDVPIESIQHHAAHVFSCMAENEVESPCLGVAWDGTGYGSDGAIWGSEFISVKTDGWKRLAHLRYFPLIGGDAAAKEPRRAALGILYSIAGSDLRDEFRDLATLQAFNHTDLNVLATMLEKNINIFPTSSAGRLFDAVASLIGLRHETCYEGQSAMELEFLADREAEIEPYEFDIFSEGLLIADWEKLVRGLIADVRLNVSRSAISTRFHETMAAIIAEVAERSGEEKIILSGGCFQNRCLAERTARRLERIGLKGIFHQRIPPNDGGIALGQAFGLMKGYSTQF